MESRLRIAGEAVHPVLVMFPLGLFTMALYTKQTIISFFIVAIGAVAGAWAYKEA